MMLSFFYYHLVFVVGLACCCLLLSNNIGPATAFLITISSSSTANKGRITRDDCSSQLSSPLLYSNTSGRICRREFIVTSIITPILIGGGGRNDALADEPMNIYYKSKADEEDPLAVFGRSLSSQTMTITTDNDDNNKGEGESKEELGQSLSLPPLPQADLSKALQEKQQSQKRRIDPRTHG